MTTISRTRKPPEGYRESPLIWYVMLDGECIGYTFSDVIAGWSWFLALALTGEAVINPRPPAVGYHNNPKRADNGYHSRTEAEMALALASGKLDEQLRAFYSDMLGGTPELRKPGS